jgi:hypothetical protein
MSRYRTFVPAQNKKPRAHFPGFAVSSLRPGYVLSSLID